MGACYSVDLTIKAKDEGQLVKAMQEYIKANPRHADFSLPKWKECGIGTETLDGLVSIMLGGWPGQSVRREEVGGGFTTYRNAFDASYGWQTIMTEMFEAMASALEDGSEFFIAADEGSVTYSVEDGTAY